VARTASSERDCLKYCFSAIYAADRASRRATGGSDQHSRIQSGNHWGSHPRGRSQSGLGNESAIESQSDLSSEPKSHSWNELRTESATESTDELENQPLSESKSDSAGQSEIDSRAESASYLQNESASDSQNDSWNDLPDANASAVSIYVRRPAPSSGSNAGRSGDDSEAGRSDVLSSPH
jgi:hypothetical protein